jgi:hypothetical protein
MQEVFLAKLGVKWQMTGIRSDVQELKSVRKNPVVRVHQSLSNGFHGFFWSVFGEI